MLESELKQAVGELKDGRDMIRPKKDCRLCSGKGHARVWRNIGLPAEIIPCNCLKKKIQSYVIKNDLRYSEMEYLSEDRTKIFSVPTVEAWQRMKNPPEEDSEPEEEKKNRGWLDWIGSIAEKAVAWARKKENQDRLEKLGRKAYERCKKNK